MEVWLPIREEPAEWCSCTVRDSRVLCMQLHVTETSSPLKPEEVVSISNWFIKRFIKVELRVSQYLSKVSTRQIAASIKSIGLCFSLEKSDNCIAIFRQKIKWNTGLMESSLRKLSTMEYSAECSICTVGYMSEGNAHNPPAPLLCLRFFLPENKSCLYWQNRKCSWKQLWIQSSLPKFLELILEARQHQCCWLNAKDVEQ